LNVCCRSLLVGVQSATCHPIRKDMRRFLSLLTLCLPLTAFAGNIKDTDLITSNTLIAGMGGCRLEI
jgi:hypothetical protein